MALLSVAMAIAICIVWRYYAIVIAIYVGIYYYSYIVWRYYSYSIALLYINSYSYGYIL